ncbi:putative protein phosphatase 2C 10 [Sesamum angolense]|uniref:PPM-type phosphatase domain-containing protein n=1 Tax=Sesamum angolense TaxID=2727404 RepID=A0AAE2C124_9LAMI|nr:putative protein phosphatase 2C 10 [Sesamum angolense]
MEDYHVAKFVQFSSHELAIFAISSEASRRYCPGLLTKAFVSKHFKRAYERTDQSILTHSPDLGRGGSTAVTAILINGRQLWVANVGDSRGVLSRRGQAIQMTIDHEPNTERGSIENRGGFVSKHARQTVESRFEILDCADLLPKKKLNTYNFTRDVARVNGQLAVSRAFGDKNLKTHLRSDPDVTNAEIDSDTDLLILASDGLWKVMSNQEAVDIAKKIRDPQKAAKQLVLEALNRDSKDDISCIVIRF